jgi:hypothetical protein
LKHFSIGNPPTLTVFHGPALKNHCLQQENYRGKKNIKKKEEEEEEKSNNLYQLKHQEHQKLQQPKGLETKTTLTCPKG